jgi:hypothetical protein
MSKLTNCKACSNEIAKTAEACPKCGAKNEWTDPRRDEFFNYLQLSGNDTLPEAWQFYGDRFSVWGETEFKTKSLESLRYALIAFVIGSILVFLAGKLPLTTANAKSILQAVITFGPFIAYPLAIMFFGKWIYHSLFTSNTNDVLQKKFRVDFSADQPVWQSNDDKFWMPIKAYVTDKSGALPNSALLEGNRTEQSDVKASSGSLSVWDSLRQEFERQSFISKVGLVIAVPIVLFALGWKLTSFVKNSFPLRATEVQDSLGNIWSPPLSGTWQCDNASQNRPWMIWSFSSDGGFSFEGVEGIAKATGQYKWEGGAKLHTSFTQKPDLNQTWYIIKGGADEWLMTNNRFEVICHK